MLKLKKADGKKDDPSLSLTVIQKADTTSWFSGEIQ